MNDQRNCNNCYHRDAYHNPNLPGVQWLCSGDRETDDSLIMTMADMDNIAQCNNWLSIEPDEDEE